MGTRLIRPVIGLLLVLITPTSPGVAVSRAQTTPGQGANQNSGPSSATRLGLDFAKPRTSAVSESDIEAAIAVLRRRVIGLGIPDARVERSRVPGEAIYIEIPTSTALAHIKDVLIANADLELRLQAKGTGTFETKKEAENFARTQSGGSGRYEVSSYRARSGNDGFAKEGWVIIENDVVIRGKDINDARAVPSHGQYYEIEFSLTPRGAERFGDATGKHIGDFLVVVLDGEVTSIATIQSQITNEGRITGRFTRQSAEDLALMLRSGMLPRPLRYVSERTAGSTR